MKAVTWTVLLVILAVLMTPDALGAPDAAEIDALCKAHESKLKPLIAERKFTEVFLAIARYEGALAGCYAPAVFEKGEFRSGAHHLKFSASGWLRSPAYPPKWTRLLAYDCFLVLEHERASLAVVEMSGFSTIPQLGNTSSDEGIEKTAKTVGNHIGLTPRTAWRTLGSNRVLVAEYGNKYQRRMTTIAFLAVGKRLFLLAMRAVPGDKPRIRDFEGMVGSAQTDYRRPFLSTIRTLRERHRGDSAEVVLTLARALAKAGEHSAAAEDLARLRAHLVNSTAAPTVSGSLGTFPGYGVTLRNPDRMRNTLSSKNIGDFSTLMIKPKQRPAQIFVALLDLAALYGPNALRILPDDAVKKRKSVISGVCLGAIQALGGKIEKQRFRKFGRRIAFEAATGVLKVKSSLKVVAILRGHVVILIIGNASWAAAYDLDWMVENLIDKDLEL